MVSVRKDLVYAVLLIAVLVLAAPVLAYAHLVPGPDPSISEPRTVDASTRAAFDAMVANDTSALAPPSAIFESIHPGDSLQAAIDAAAPGSTLYLDPGVYYEHDLVVNKPLWIQANATLGGNRANTIIDARGEGRIFTVEGGNALLLNELTLRNGFISGNGGAVATTGGHIILLATTVTNCSATGNGGALYSDGGIVYVVYSTISRSSATGPMYLSTGGAIYSEDGVVMAGYSSFSDCSAPHAWGGAIESRSPLLVTYSTFTRCSAIDGGALDFYDDGAMVAASTFTDCTATGNGGAMWYLDGGSLELADSTVTRCSAAMNGGAIAADGDMYIGSVSFNGCSAGGDGGAILSAFSGALTAVSSTFTGCSAGGYGGAIHATGPLTITSSSLTGNSAPDEGGAIYMSGGSTGTISFSRFYQNTADHGPAIAVMGDVNADNNWWGTNDGPAGQVHGWYHATPWLVLGITADPMALTLPETSYIRTNLTYDSDGTNTAGGGIYVPDAIPNIYAVVSGPGTVAPATVGSVNGAAQGTYVTTTAGTPTIAGTVDGQAVYITLNVAQGTWTPAPTQVPSDDDWPKVGTGASGGGGGGSAAPTGSSGFPLMTVTVNIGGDSKAHQAIVTGTKISELIVTGTMQHNAGDNVTAPTGIVYQYISLVPARYNSITNAVINFTVPQEWLHGNSIAHSGIMLYRLTSNGWEALPTTFLYTKDGTAHFSAQSTGFSIFAIAGTQTVATPVATVTTPQDNTPQAEQTPAAAAVVKTTVTTQTTAPPAPAAPQPPAGSAPVPVLPALLGLCCVGLIGGGWYARRWWIRRQNPALFAEYD